MITTSDMIIILVADICVIMDYRLSFHCSVHHNCERFDWAMNVLENGTDVNAWNNIRYLFMMYTIIINGFLILVFAFISASFSTRFKYYFDLDVNLIKYSADVKAKNSIRNLMMMMMIIIIPYVALVFVH